MTRKMKAIQMQILPILKKAGVLRSGIFGSFARGDEQEDSDLDILVELKRGQSYFDLANLQEELELALGRKIDIGTYNSIHPAIKEEVLKQEERIL